STTGQSGSIRSGLSGSGRHRALPREAVEIDLPPPLLIGDPLGNHAADVDLPPAVAVEVESAEPETVYRLAAARHPSPARRESARLHRVISWAQYPGPAVFRSSVVPLP